MNILKKLQSLPERTRKIILWITVIIISLGLLSWWVKNFQQKLKSFKTREFKKELKIPSLEKELKNLPKLEVPQNNEERE
jgi:polyferredoxin